METLEERIRRVAAEAIEIVPYDPDGLHRNREPDLDAFRVTMNGSFAVPLFLRSTYQAIAGIEINVKRIEPASAKEIVNPYLCEITFPIEVFHIFEIEFIAP